MGVTRGGFYGHFANRQALLAAMLDTWERTSTEEIIQRVESEGGDANTRLRRLFALSFTIDRDALRINLAVRDWARRDDEVAERLSRVDNRRVDYLRSLFTAFCPDEDDVEARCLVAMSLFVGSHFVVADFGGRSRTEVVALALQHLEAP